ncbi:MAG: hypothetical protein V1897_01705 [Pseudomonadota bacterium]
MECLMDHIVLNVEDDEKMISFYSKVLLMPPERLDEYRAGNVPFPSLRLNADTIIDLFPKKMWGCRSETLRFPMESQTFHGRLRNRCLSDGTQQWVFYSDPSRTDRNKQ